MRSAAAELARDPKAFAAFLKKKKSEGEWQGLLYDWGFWADRRQLPPEGAWRTWLLMAGRGFGKTRAGSEWVRAAANAKVRIAIVGATRNEARQVMVEGESGILAVTPPAERPVWQPTQGRLHWPASGAEAYIHSGENPDGLRGPQFHMAWCDELAKWAYPDATWDNLQMTLRLGDDPRALVTTTPRPTALVRRLADDAGVAKAGRGRTADNLFLSPGFAAAMQDHYGGTRLGRQELDGELIGELPGALWTRSVIEACRVRHAPDLTRVVVAVDPPAGTSGDACGIVAVGLGADGLGYVLADASVAGLTPEGWARAVAACARDHGADRVVAESNQGGAMVRSVLHAADAGLPVSPVHATLGKSRRAEPVAALYETGKVKHVGAFPALEDEMCGLMAGGGYDGPGRSPDRADALVWAVQELMLGARGAARVRVV